MDKHLLRNKKLIKEDRQNDTFAIHDQLPDPASSDLHFLSSFCSLHPKTMRNEVDNRCQIFPTDE